MKANLDRLNELNDQQLRLLAKIAINTLSEIHAMTAVMPRATQEAVWREMIQITDLMEGFKIVNRKG